MNSFFFLEKISFNLLNIEMKQEDHLVPIQDTCNQKCIFCSSWGNQNTTEFPDIIRMIIKKDNYIQISGGEPLLNKDVFKVIKFIRKYKPWTYIEFQTNGVLLLKNNNLDKLIEQKVDLYNINWPCHIDTVTDAIVWVPNTSLPRELAMKEVIAKWEKLRINIIINKLNYPYLEAMIDYIQDNFSGLDRIQLSFVKAMWAAQWAKDVIPTYEEASPFIIKFLEKAKKYNIRADIDHIPLCFLWDFYQNHVDYMKIKDHLPWVHLTEKWYIDKCKDCKLKKYCSGYRKDYLDLYKEGNDAKVYGKWVDYNIWHIINIFPKNEFYGVLYGLKTVSYRWISEREIKKNKEKIDELFNQHNLIYDILKDKDWNHIIIYSKERKYIDDFLESYEKKDNFSIQCGYLLGYPNCCIWTEDGKWVWDSVSIAFNNSQKLNYKLNSIFHYGGRWFVEKLQWISSKEVITEGFSLLNYQPCSYDCEKSIEYAEKMEKILEKEDPKYLDLIYQKTKKNYLYFNPENRISLENINIETKQEIRIFEWILTKKNLIDIMDQSYFIEKKGEIIKLYDKNDKNIKEFTIGKWGGELRSKRVCPGVQGESPSGERRCPEVKEILYIEFNK